MIDGNKKPSMGYIYEATDRAKEAIAKSFLNKEENYEEVIKHIDTRWKCQLKPKIYYSNPFIEDCRSDEFEWISRMVPDLATLRQDSYPTKFI